ncbi:MAG TPA: hypothetical protein P5104_04055 [Bacteroidales bacterium]|nr:hypothetical protein [Bacteroidales bacterium]
MRNIFYLNHLILLFLFAFPTISVKSQSEGNFDLGADFVSRYVWRGSDFANSPSIQPYVSYSVKSFQAEIWGAFATTTDYQEVDLVLSYMINEMFTFQLTDYFFPNGTNFNNNYFDFSKKTTGHLMEGTIAFEGTDEIPLRVSANYNFYGNDPDKSWYFEMGYSGTVSEFSYEIFLGATPGKGVYLPDGSDGFKIINTGFSLSKEIKITDHFSLPVSGALIVNPQAENLFFVLGISL